MIQLRLKLNPKFAVKTEHCFVFDGKHSRGFIFREASRRFGTDEVAPLLPGGEKDLRFSAVPQGRGLRHGGRSRGRFHGDLRKRGGDSVRRRHTLGKKQSPMVFEAFRAQRRDTSDQIQSILAARRLTNAPVRLFSWQVAGNKKPLRPLHTAAAVPWQQAPRRRVAMIYSTGG